MNIYAEILVWGSTIASGSILLGMAVGKLLKFNARRYPRA